MCKGISVERWRSCERRFESVHAGTLANEQLGKLSGRYIIKYSLFQSPDLWEIDFEVDLCVGVLIAERTCERHKLISKDYLP